MSNLKVSKFKHFQNDFDKGVHVNPTVCPTNKETEIESFLFLEMVERVWNTNFIKVEDNFEWLHRV